MLQRILEREIEMKVGVTGYSSELGEAVCRHLAQEGHEILLLGRKSQHVYFDYAKQVCENLVRVDSLIFLSHDYSLSEQNVNRAAQWLETTLLKINAPKALYISSRSVHPANPSTYSFHKNALEKVFINLNYEVLRLGLINQSDSSRTQTRPVRLLTKILKPLPFSIQLNRKLRFFSCDIEEVAAWITKWTDGTGHKSVHTFGDQIEMDFLELCSQFGIQRRKIKVTLPVKTLKWIFKQTKLITKKSKNGGLDKIINGFSGMY